MMGHTPNNAEPAFQKAESRWLRPSSVLTSLVVIFAFTVIVPIAWLVATTHISGAPSAQTVTVNLLATLGGLMGAIFTVGGLVIALVAVLSQLTLEQRVRTMVQVAYDELVPASEQRLLRRLAALSAMQQAKLVLTSSSLVDDWNTVIELTTRAVIEDPELQGARSQLALAMYEAYVGDVYEQQICGDQPVRNSPLQQWSLAWLERAESAHDDPDGKVTAALAVMSGHMRNRTDMMARLDNILKSNSGQKDVLVQSSRSLILLAYSCADLNEDKQIENIRELGKKLGIELPRNREAILQSLTAASQLQGESAVRWLVLGKGIHPNYGALDTPREVRIVVPNPTTSSDARADYATPLGTGHVQIPSPPNNMLPRDALVDQLLQTFTFICRSDTPDGASVK